MRIFLFSFVFLLLSICQPVLGQQPQTTTVSGIMQSSEGEPLPGVSIRIKGTDRGTTSDINGYYSLEAPVGSTLVVSFIGFNTYEVKVQGTTASQQKKQKLKAKISSEKRFPDPGPGREEVGVAVLSDSSASYKVEGRNYTNAQQMIGPLAKIKEKGRKGKQRLLLVPSYVQQRRRAQLRLEYTTALSRSVANRLPDLQQRYAQGRTVNGKLEARGPEARELFSWGPALSSLSQDASGNLVPKTAGLPPAQAFDPYRAFRPGISTDNHLQLFSEIADFKLRGGYGFKSGQGIIPGNNYNRHAMDFSGQLNNRALEPRLYLSYSLAEEHLPQRGANLGRIISSIYTSPSSFDLLNGISGSRPWQNPSAYQDDQGRELSYAPGLVNHPFRLIHQSPDVQKQERFLSGLDVQANQLYPFHLQYNVVFEQQNAAGRFGMPKGTVGTRFGHLTERQQQTRSIHSKLSAAADPELYSDVLELDLYAAYLFNYQQESLWRQDGLGFKAGSPYEMPEASLSREIGLQPFRRQHELISKANLYFLKDYFRIVELGLLNRMYFSNTLAVAPAYFLPAATLKVDLSWLDFIQNSWLVSRPSFFAAYASTLQEAPLLYNQWHFNSLLYPAHRFREYMEMYELSPQSGIRPERQHKWELGTEMDLFENNLNLKLSYYQNITQDFMLPNPERMALENVAEVLTPGLELVLHSQGYLKEGSWQAGMTFSRSRPRVKTLYLEEERLPIAGFSDISTNLIEGEPLGVMVGSRFLRDEKGRKVIGDDGFPLLSPEAGIIGNPNPDWQASLNGGIKYKKLGFSFVIEGRKGGDVWNGTQQFLNYYGASPLTAAQRELKGYVFEGVTQEGGVNRQPVDFYDPALPVENNRWQRYGVAGVGEEGVEEASLIRINEVQLTYDLSRAMNNLLGGEPFEQLRLSLLARNLLLYTSYTGLDPAGNLFAYQQGRGLDLFNQPATQSLGIALNIIL